MLVKMRYPPALVEMFGRFDGAQVAAVAYVLTADLRLARTNPAWDAFARANDGAHVLERWPLGASIVGTFPEPLRDFYVAGFANARHTRERWDHAYECSSASIYRRFRMLVYPYADWFLVTHALLVENPHAEPAGERGDVYVNDGVIAMCSHCRRVKHVLERERWDWVPSYVEALPPNVSHGLCPACFDYYYPG